MKNMTKKQIIEGIEDEKLGIKFYSGKKGFKTQVTQEKAHLRKLKRKLKQYKK